MSKCRCNNCSSTTKDVDLIIIGAGTAGLPAAWALSNKRRGESLYSVLVLETGTDHNDDVIVTSPNNALNPELSVNPKYASTSVTLAGEVYTEGEGVGGSSLHNGLQAVRGTPEIYNKWAEITGNPRWKYSELLPLFKNQEHYTPNGTPINREQRGTNGRLFITQDPPVNDAFSAAVAVGLSVPLIDDYSNHYRTGPNTYANTVGVSANQTWTTPPPNSIRCYSGNAYLYGIPEFGIPPIVDEDGVGLNGRKLRVITSGKVVKILFSQNKAVGVKVTRNINGQQECQKYFANKGVILSAGVINSAAILQLSGIGDRNLLEPLGIKVIVNNPNVGANVQNHYGPNGLIRRLQPPAGLQLTAAFAGLYPYLPDKTSRQLQVVCLFPSNIVFTPLIFNPSPLIALGVDKIPSEWMGGLLLQTSSRGTVKIQSRDPLTDPFLNLGNYTDVPGPEPWKVVGSDAYKAVSYYKLLQDIAVAQGGTSSDVLFPPNSAYPAPWGPAPDDNKLFETAKSNVFIASHASGSCRMAKTARDGVVDGNLKVFGTENLWIADCSIEPVIQTGNTAYMAYFIGLELAKIFGADI